MDSDEKDLSRDVAGTSAPNEHEPVQPPGDPVPMRRPRRWPLVLLMFVATAGLLVALWNWNWFKGYVEHQVTVATGRRFHIDGSLDVRLSMQPQITMDHLRLESPSGLRPVTMATVDRLQFRVDLRSLVRGDDVFPEVLLVHPVAHLLQGSDGLDNWEFPASTSNPIIRQLAIEDGLLTYREDAKRTDFSVAIQTDHAANTKALAPLLFKGSGTYRNNPFTLHGRADSPLELRSTTTPYRVDVTADAGPTRARASGALRNPLQASGFDLDFALSGPDMGLLYKLMGVATPETPPYHLQGHLGHVGHVWTYRNFTGAVGSSDLAGDVLVDNRVQRRFMKVELSSRKLDVHDLAGFIGAPARANPAKAATPQQHAEAVQAQSNDRLFPTRTFELDRLRSMDTDVTLHARAVSGTPVPLNDFSTHFVLLNGRVTMDPFDFAAAGGTVRSKIAMDASRPVITSAVTLRAHGIDLSRLVPEVPAIRRSAGTIGATVDLRGSGNSVERMFATSNGHLSAGMGGGRISDLMMAYAALNIARILKLRISGDHDEAIHCVVGDFVAKDGQWTVNSLVFDSEDTVIRGSGAIDMRDETLDLTLRVKPRHNSLLSLRAPLYVQGDLRHPDIRPDYRVIGLRGVAVAVLGSIALPAAEIGLVDVGGSRDTACPSPERPTARTASSESKQLTPKAKPAAPIAR